MRNIKLLLMVLPFCASHNLYAQLVRKPVSSSYAGVGAYSATHSDVFSVLSNTAALTKVKQFSAGVYGEQRFMLKELMHYLGAFALPTQSGNFAVTTAYQGGSYMNDYQIGLAYARSLGKTIDIGVRFNYNGLKVNGYGNASAIGMELGTVLHFTEKLHGGLQVVNPVSSKFGINKQEKFASVYSLGIGYEASEKFFVSTAFVKEEDKANIVQADVQYKILPFLQLRGGVSTGTTSYWLGVGLGWKNIRLDIVSGYHNQLGLSPGLMIIYENNHQP